MPPEIWREIFSFATSIHGLAYSHWDNKDVRKECSTSLSTRHSIPLVCRSWNLAGTSFLYERLVLQRIDQIERLEQIFEKAETAGCGLEYRSWVRGLELVPGPEMHGQGDFFQLALQLLERQRFPQVTIFGIDSNIQPMERQELVLSVAKTAIQVFGSQLEYLHLPATDNSWKWGTMFSDSQGTPVLDISLPSLHTLSMTSGKWVGTRSVAGQYFDALATSPHRSSLRTLSVEWFRRDKETFFKFLRTTPRLHTLHFGKSSFWESVCELPAILELLPGLRQLYFEYAPPISRERIVLDHPQPQIHFSLSKIIIQAGGTTCLNFITTTNVIFAMIQKGWFPRLEVIELQLRDSRSCLDLGENFNEADRKAWRNAIATCATAGIRLVAPNGDPIHLWADKHGVKRNPLVEKKQEQPPNKMDSVDYAKDESGPEEDSEESEDEDEDEDEIYTHSEDNSSRDSGFTGPISDDSEDAAYKWWDQPDIVVESDSESEPVQANQESPFLFLI